MGKELQLNASFYSPMDYEGHGTHTLSTAGGAFVPNANIAGYGNGTAKGGSPNARVASYKICFIRLINGDQCFDADFLAAIDVAIADGVDILSLSIGGDPNELFSDAEAIGSFHAVKSGITVLCSAGNDGRPGSVSNIAPWIITVAANTFDREFPSYVILGNGKRLKVCTQTIDNLIMCWKAPNLIVFYSRPLISLVSIYLTARYITDF